MRRPVQRAKAGKGEIEIERRVGELRPARQSEAMLGFLFAPTFDASYGRFGRAAIHALQIIDIVRRVVFDERRSLDRRQQFAVDFRTIETGPVDIVEGPAFTVDCPIGHPQTPWPMLTTECKTLPQQCPALQAVRPGPENACTGLQFR